LSFWPSSCLQNTPKAFNLRRMMKRILLFCTILTLVCPQAFAETQPRKLGKFDYWSAYQMAEGKQSVCYMTLTAKPPVPKGSKLKRDSVTLMITHRPTEGALDVFSYAAGTKFAASSEVTVKAGEKTFSLFTQGDTAWARDPATDHALAQALRSNASITVTGTAAVGGSFADTISMKGSSKAYQAMAEACGLSQPSAPAKAKPAPKASKPK